MCPRSGSMPLFFENLRSARDQTQMVVFAARSSFGSGASMSFGRHGELSFRPRWHSWPLAGNVQQVMSGERRNKAIAPYDPAKISAEKLIREPSVLRTPKSNGARPINARIITASGLQQPEAMFVGSGS